MTDRELGWLAGIIDGEGTISVTMNRGVTRPMIQVVNTNTTIIVTVQSMIEMIIGRKPFLGTQKRSGTSIKQCYRLYVTKQSEVERLLVVIEPYLVGKRDAAVLLLQYVRQRLAVSLGGNRRGAITKEDEALAQQIRLLSCYRPYRESVESGGVGTRIAQGEGAFRTATGVAETSGNV